MIRIARTDRPVKAIAAGAVAGNVLVTHLDGTTEEVSINALNTETVDDNDAAYAAAKLALKPRVAT